ncbi:hypothetical protein H0H92_005921 [Tricholoma furcatifolium]|nr:hypothetical protein H0H92_005921 [Tricholoma furcatifolium]
MNTAALSDISFQISPAGMEAYAKGEIPHQNLKVSRLMMFMKTDPWDKLRLRMAQEQQEKKIDGSQADGVLPSRVYSAPKQKDQNKGLNVLPVQRHSKEHRPKPWSGGNWHTWTTHGIFFTPGGDEDDATPPRNLCSSRGRTIRYISKEDTQRSGVRQSHRPRTVSAASSCVCPTFGVKDYWPITDKVIPWLRDQATTHASTSFRTPNIGANDIVFSPFFPRLFDGEDSNDNASQTTELANDIVAPVPEDTGKTTEPASKIIVSSESEEGSEATSDAAELESIRSAEHLVIPPRKHAHVPDDAYVATTADRDEHSGGYFVNAQGVLVTPQQRSYRPVGTEVTTASIRQLVSLDKRLAHIIA